ncbi:cell surface A33 antigen isoform X3 [Salmo salar]|uniref:Cell surface A33 antigen isoform X3 n=1 Tax=Salmo salar TaxID=8030 RepID=A0A1S3S120_SALSA|nr:cell surface A33 antigen-like isoform X3 [Salmo salar]|eukprot:XP_014058105.1 PREDICTED: cell surface A33 antigen-like isoform X1 [Salmo salar]
MWISVCLISSFLHSTAGCTLSVTNYDEITVYSGQSVLLTCSCTEPQAKPPSVTWTRLNQQHEILTKPSQDSLYRDRVKMFNNNSPGNLSVLLSHVTEDDVGWYRCGISHAYRDIKLTVKGCTLSDPRSRVVNGSPGQSVLLPCSCSKTQAKPPSFTWTKLRDHQTPERIPTQSDLYKGRVNIFNNTAPGNLSLRLSHVTEDDQGWYRCQISREKYSDIKLTVKDSTTFLIPTTSPKGADTLGTSGEDPSASPQQNNTIQYILLAVLPVILIIAGVALYIYKRNKGKKNTEEKSSGGKTEGEKKDDPSVMYDTVQEPRNNNQEETTTPLSAPEDPSVTYSTIVHMKGKRNAVVSLERGGETEYATIKTGTFS